MKDAFMRSNAISIETVPDAGKRFRQLREQASKTQKEVANAVGMRPEALSRFETGSGANFTLAKLLQLLQVLEVHMEFVPTTSRPTLTTLLAERRSNSNVGPNAH